MRQQGTMKVMWNIRLFKGMQLLPRQVSDGDRRMDVYVKMVLVDNGQPKSYAIKVHTPPSSLTSTGHLLIKVTKPYTYGSTVRSNQTRHSNMMYLGVLDFLFSSHGELRLFVFERTATRMAEELGGRLFYKYIHKRRKYSLQIIRKG